MGQKPDDFVAYLCYACHDVVDGRADVTADGVLYQERQDREELWLRAFFKSLRWQIENNLL
jgi:hypothetical protein